MTKISFDVDFNQDPEKVLKEIQKRAEAEVAKRESKEKHARYLSSLHETVNKEIDTNYKNINELIKALTSFATPAFRDKLSTSTPGGRRQTISMSKEIYDKIKSALAEPNPNKAGIARETGVSVVQVRKVDSGGYDKKFGGAISETLIQPASKSEEDESAPSEQDSPSAPSFGDQNDIIEPISPQEEPSESPDLPPHPSFVGDEGGLDLAPPPSVEAPSTPAPDLPPPPSFEDDKADTDDAADSEDEAPSLPLPADLPPPPSFGDDSADDGEEDILTDEAA